jgi:hypothetical protein
MGPLCTCQRNKTVFTFPGLPINSKINHKSKFIAIQNHVKNKILSFLDINKELLNLFFSNKYFWRQKELVNVNLNILKIVNSLKKKYLYKDISSFFEKITYIYTILCKEYLISSDVNLGINFFILEAYFKNPNLGKYIINTKNNEKCSKILEELFCCYLEICTDLFSSQKLTVQLHLYNNKYSKSFLFILNELNVFINLELFLPQEHCNSSLIFLSNNHSKIKVTSLTIEKFSNYEYGIATTLVKYFEKNKNCLKSLCIREGQYSERVDQNICSDLEINLDNLCTLVELNKNSIQELFIYIPYAISFVVCDNFFNILIQCRNLTKMELNFNFCKLDLSVLTKTITHLTKLRYLNINTNEVSPTDEIQCQIIKKIKNYFIENKFILYPFCEIYFFTRNFHNMNLFSKDYKELNLIFRENLMDLFMVEEFQKDEDLIYKNIKSLIDNLKISKIQKITIQENKKYSNFISIYLKKLFQQLEEIGMQIEPEEFYYIYDDTPEGPFESIINYMSLNTTRLKKFYLCPISPNSIDKNIIKFNEDIKIIYNKILSIKVIEFLEIFILKNLNFFVERNKLKFICNSYFKNCEQLFHLLTSVLTKKELYFTIKDITINLSIFPNLSRGLESSKNENDFNSFLNVITNDTNDLSKLKLIIDDNTSEKNTKSQSIQQNNNFDNFCQKISGINTLKTIYIKNSKNNQFCQIKECLDKLISFNCTLRIQILKFNLFSLSVLSNTFNIFKFLNDNFSKFSNLSFLKIKVRKFLMNSEDYLSIIQFQNNKLNKIKHIKVVTEETNKDLQFTLENTYKQLEIKIINTQLH